MNKALLQAINEHKKKLTGPHFIFSAENPAVKPELDMTHEQVINHLRSAGYDAHSVNGHYGAPERSIIAYGVSGKQAEHLHKLASRLGQHSSLYSDGTNHELRFHQGKAKGKRLRGTGTDWHDHKPQDNYTALPGGVHHFSHRFGQEDDLEKGESNSVVQGVADQYAKGRGITLSHGTSAKVNPAFSAKVAHAYDQMKHDPNHPDVKAAYGALVGETKDQFHHITNSGLKVSRIKPDQENPYKTSKDLHDDIRQNNHMWYFPTDQGFGTDGSSPHDHPLLQPTGVKHDGHEMLANDMFRVVHDYFGHAKEGHNFGSNGEESAYQDHAQMFSPLARKALTTETRGQNSWVNFGPHAAHNKANPQKTIYADQKAGLLPEWAEGDPHGHMHKSEDLEKGQNGDWAKEGYSISHSTSRPSGYASHEQLITVKASHPKHGHVGIGEFLHDRKAKTIKPLNSGVHADHRRKGLASAMYSHAEKVSGAKMVPSDDASEDADKLWSAKGRSFGKSEQHFTYLTKSADDDAYKKQAHKGMALMYPVSINGKTHNPNNGIAYHNTIKVFNADKDSAKDVHATAKQIPFRAADPKQVEIEPIILHGQGGYVVHALELKGHHANETKAHNARLKHLGNESPYDFKSHVSIDKETWKDIKNKGHKTAHDAGIQFGDAELRHGGDILARYQPASVTNIHTREQPAMPGKKFGT